MLEGYEFREDFTVPPTVTFTVEPGVMVMGTGSRELLIQGYLNALGTEIHPITFTSATNTGAAQWSGLVFDGSQGGGTGNLRHLTVRYGGHGNRVLAGTDNDHSGSNVMVNGVLTGEVRLEHVILTSEYHWDGWHAFGDHGLYVGDSQVIVTDSIVENNCDAGSDDSGVYVTSDSTVWIADSLIQSNDAPGLMIAGDTVFVTVSGSSIRNSLDFCYNTCDQNVDNWKCDESTRDCVTSHRYIETPCIDCEYKTDLNTWNTCGPNARCINNNCEPIDVPETDNHEFEILVASDPNEMVGPPAAIPGQWRTA